MIDGVVHDTYDCTRNGTRCVYGYWTLAKAGFQFILDYGVLLGLSLRSYYELDGPITRADIDAARKAAP